MLMKTAKSGLLKAMTGEVRMSYNSSKAMDDWLITPGLDLKAGHVYDLSFDSYVKQADCEETFEVSDGQCQHGRGDGCKAHTFHHDIKHRA